MQNKSLRTPSGVQISIRHERVAKESVIVVAHGFFQSKETKTFRNIEKEFMDAFDVISMDFRGHGKSEGFYTFSSLEKEDLKAVVDYAREHYKKVGVLGFSYGGSIAIIEQAEFRNIDSIICVSSPMASDEIEFKWWTPDAVKLGVKGLEPGAGVRPGNPWLEKVKAINVVSLVSPSPIFFIHGDKDPTVHHRHSQMLYNAAKEPKVLKILPAGSHAEELYRQFPKQFIEEAKNWFFDTLKN